MQKATYYDSAAIYGGYPYPGANGYTYNASQQQYPLESDYHRPACSLQSPGSAGPHHKASDINESCMRAINSQSSQDQQQQQPTPPSVSPPQQHANNPATAATTKATSISSPTMAKQIFPWMKESRQNTKQKATATTAAAAAAAGGNSSSGNGSSFLHSHLEQLLAKLGNKCGT